MQCPCNGGINLCSSPWRSIQMWLSFELSMKNCSLFSVIDIKIGNLLWIWSNRHTKIYHRYMDIILFLHGQEIFMSQIAICHGLWEIILDGTPFFCSCHYWTIFAWFEKDMDLELWYVTKIAPTLWNHPFISSEQGKKESNMRQRASCATNISQAILRMVVRSTSLG